MASALLLVDQADGVATLTLNRPEKSNAFNDAMLHELMGALDECAAHPNIGCIVLTGAGRNFCAGQDLSSLEARPDVNGGLRNHLEHGYNRLVSRMRAIEKPILGAINGAAAGAGLGLACACDLRFGSETAKFRMAFIGIGLVPDSGTSYMLPRLIGFARALEMALTNEPLDAAPALACGLLNRVFPGDELMPRTLEFARKLAAGPRYAAGLTKRTFYSALKSDFESALELEASLQEIAARSPEHRERVQAFLARKAIS